MPDRIVSQPSTQAYRDNYDRVFGKKEQYTIGPLQSMVREATACLRGVYSMDVTIPRGEWSAKRK